MTPPGGESTWARSGQAFPVAGGRVLETKLEPQNAAASSTTFCTAPSATGGEANVRLPEREGLQESK